MLQKTMSLRTEFRVMSSPLHLVDIKYSHFISSLANIMPECCSVLCGESSMRQHPLLFSLAFSPTIPTVLHTFLLLTEKQPFHTKQALRGWDFAPAY